MTEASRAPVRPPRVPGLEPRRLAAALLARVLAGEFLDALLESGLLAERLGRLPPPDRGLVRALVGTALRRKGSIDGVIRARLARPLPRKAAALQPVLAVAAAQILFMDVPAHAAVSLAVTEVGEDSRLAGWKGLTNALLRRIAREKDDILALPEPGRRDTPGWLFARWVEAYGPQTAEAIAAAQRIEPSLDLTVKSDPEGWAARLGGIELPTGTVRLAGAGSVTELPGFATGDWWVQDAAAGLPPRLLGAVNGQRVADLCAAPGGKTALLAQTGARVTAVDVSAGRLKRVAANLARLGLTAEIVAADAAGFAAEPFDAVLLDAPCSATGTIRRHPDVAWLKTPATIDSLVPLQANLLANAVRLTRPGGVLVYSTCSLEPEEGQGQIARLLADGAPVERVPIDPAAFGGAADWVTPDGDLRTLPCHLPHADPRLAGLDGFYAARLRRV